MNTISDTSSQSPKVAERPATAPSQTRGRRPKRAICLGGGGPAAGLHIGALKGLAANGIEFNNEGDVWALSCIGAWIGIIYNQATKGHEIPETIKFFRDVFRNDRSFKSFPANTVFTPDWAGNAEAMLDFLTHPGNYRNAFLPREIMKSFLDTMSAFRRGSTMRRRTRRYGDEEISDYEHKEFSEGDFNRWTLNHVLAVHPVVRFFTAMAYKAKIDGLSRLYYPDSSFLNKIRFDEVRNRAPFVYYNAWNLSRQKLVLFANKRKQATVPADAKVLVEGYRPIDAASLCACSALPYVEQTITIDGDIYCEGALIDTLNFENLLEDHQDLDEIWISRIVDANQVLPPRNLHDSLANLCELFCATVGEDNIDIFKYRLKYEKPERWKRIKIVEIPVDCTINFEWSHANLEHGIKAGEAAADRAYQAYMEKKGSLSDDDWNARGGILIRPPEDVVRKQQERRKLAQDRLTEAGRGDG